jgi:multidrug efflux pump
MNLSRPFIMRPVGTTLLTIAIALAGCLGYKELPVSPLPQVDFPTISVQAQLPGASPEVVSTSLAEPLERHLGQIADVTEITSQSQTGQTRITMQFSLDRDINGAAEDVQAAINAAQADLPTNLLSQPTYRKVNPADAPVLILALTSDTLTRGQMYDAASSILEQQLSQVSGVGEVIVGGAAQPAVRVEMNPLKLQAAGIGLEDVRSALSDANANTPKGSIDIGSHRWQIYTNDQSSHADDYKPMIIAYRNGDAVQLQDVADVSDNVENIRNMGLADGKPAVLVIIFRQPGANIITTVDAVHAAIPKLKTTLPSDLKITFASDRSTTIRSSLSDTQRTLIIAVVLVVGVVFVFLRSGRAALIPAIAVPVSIIGTFGAMYMMGYSLDNLSLMALTIATGFVVDDAIVVLENVSRYLEEGLPPVEAALRGAQEVGFTVISITISLIAVFLPILLMGGLIGRLFREFAMTLTMAIVISMLLSLTTTPMMCAIFLRSGAKKKETTKRSLFERVQDFYARTLRSALDHSLIVVLLLLVTVGLNVWLIDIIPKSFFPIEDTGRLTGTVQADQGISFQAMSKKFEQIMAIVQKDPAVQDVVGYTGTGSGGGSSQTNTGSVYVSLKPLSKRPGATAVMARLRKQLAQVPGATLFLQPVQDLRVGGRQSNALYQYTLEGDSAQEIYQWAPKLLAALKKDKALTDVNSDQQQGGLETNLVIDRQAASRLGLTMYQIDNTIYDAFGQRSVSTIYSSLNQYYVVMEVAPEFWQSPETLTQLWISTSGGAPSGTGSTQLVSGTVSSGAVTALPTASAMAPVRPVLSSATLSAKNTNLTITSNVTPLVEVSAAGTTTTSASSGATTQSQSAIATTGNGSASSGSAVSTAPETMVPLSAVAHAAPANTPLSVNHQSGYVAATISFNLAAGSSLSDAATAIQNAGRSIRMPHDLIGGFAGTALVYEQSLSSETMLVTTALVAIYIVLGLLYESFVHPITILSTLPSAGVGAVLALIVLDIPFTLIALIGVILLIGIVKKNAILMIDFALEAQRKDGMNSRDAIYQAAVLRFRPIMMTTTAALLGALPLCFSFGEGSELRQPLGISIVGGLLVSQVLTLYTTPVVYLYLDRMRLFVTSSAHRLFSGTA